MRLTGISLRLWEDELQCCPFDCRDDELFVAYSATAETGSFDVLGWPRPRRVFDLLAEFRCLTNGSKRPHGAKLIGALLHFGLPTIGAEEKKAMQDLAKRGGPFTETERQDLLEYCESDVDALLRLLLPIMQARNYAPGDFGRALLRGRYLVNLAVVENIGPPIDVALFGRLLRHFEGIKRRLVKAVDADFGVYREDGSFNRAAFEAYLERHGIPWPRLESGALSLEDDTFRQRARTHPEIAPLHELRYTMGQLQPDKLTVGRDGRNRTPLWAFGSKTGRNQPSTNKFIFGPAVWLRCLLKPSPGRAIAYVDWSAQEIAIAACLSRDDALWATYASGDAYIYFATVAGMVPADADKDSHPAERAICKILFLGIGYGMSAEGLALQSGLHIVTARKLLRLHREAYPVFWAWADDNVHRAFLGMTLRTTFGWQIRFPWGSEVEINPRSILNWPMQANGAEMMRLGLTMAVEAGLQVCAPVHDALLLEAPDDEIAQQAARLAEIMGDASELVLGPGRRCRCDGIKEKDIVRWPNRYSDKRGAVMFRRVMELLEETEAAAGSVPVAEPVSGD